jgi:hypothetical protein
MGNSQSNQKRNFALGDKSVDTLDLSFDKASLLDGREHQNKILKDQGANDLAKHLGEFRNLTALDLSCEFF